MKTHGTVRKMTGGQRGDLIATMVGAIPDLTFEEAQAIIGRKGPLVAEIRDVFAKRRLNTTPFTVTVDYTQTVEEMVQAGKYDWKNSDISSKNFPVKRREPGKVEVHLIHFNRAISSDDAIKELDRMGFRLAELPELLALGAQHPDEQKKYPIIALGSVWQDPGGDRDVPYLVRNDSGRGLSLGWFEGGWGEDYRFAAVRK